MSSPAPTNPEAPRPPAPVVPDYELERRIGRGSYGEVWLAHSALETRRAVKVVYRASFDSERPYLREFEGIRQYEPVSSHESQVRVYHVGKNDDAGYFYYVMELADDATTLGKTAPVPGGEAAPVEIQQYTPATLTGWLKQRGRLPSAEALPIALALASALEHLHRHGLVHRDIKPSNVVFVGGRPKLADIGLVTSVTSADTLVGTTGYIPPEGPGTPQADLFSLGKVLYEAVTGRDRQDFPNLPEDLAKLPDRAALLEFNEIILKCCHGNSRERYASAAELLADLKRIAAGRSLRKDRARRRQTVAIAVSALVGLCGFALWQFTRPPAASGDTSAGAGVTNAPVSAAPSPVRATNSLGMVFVAVPGLAAEFSIWETRMSDFKVFFDETGHKADVAHYTVDVGNEPKELPRTWLQAGASTGPDHPVRAVSCEDAMAFCEWLTQRERKTGQLDARRVYRLPRDAEWSWAAGLTNEVGDTVVERQRIGRNLDRYYWGRNWPPPPGAGNFSGAESIMVQHVRGYSDPFPRTAPVGSFPVEANGLFDMAGNVSEFCEDQVFTDGSQTPQHVARGANWECYTRVEFRIARRLFFNPHEARVNCGFRVVRATLP